MESIQAGFGDRCVLQAALSAGKWQQCRIQHHFDIDPRRSGGGFGCLCRALLTLIGLQSARGCWGELWPPQRLRLHSFLSLAGAGAVLALVK